MMKHYPYEGWILDDIDLDETRRADLEAHLALCPQCAQLSRSLRIALQAIRNAPEQTAPAGFVHKFVSSFESRRRLQERKQARTLAIVFASTALIVVLVSLYVFLPELSLISLAAGAISAAELALEPVSVKQRQEELEVLLLAVVRRRGHQEEVARKTGEDLPQPVALRILDLSSKKGRRKLVGLVADDQVIAAVGGTKLVLHIFISRQLVQPGNRKIVLKEPVAGAGGFEFVIGKDLERQVEAAVHFILPLLSQAAGADDETALEIAARD